MNPTPLNSLTCPLDGANLIEAAAGTGKTYNIQNLTVRLILERNLPVESILVLTFTEAAAAELRRRIRSILQTTLSFLQQPEPGPEEGREAALIEAAATAPEPTDRAECVRRLRRALLHFDEATITTIHGFCRRVLGDFAFESGVLFNSRLEKEYSKLLLELAQDFYRRNFYRKEHAALRALFAERSALTPEELMRPAARRIGQPQIRFRSRAARAPEEYLEEAARCLEEVKFHFRAELFDRLEGKLNKPYKGEWFDSAAARIAGFAAGAGLDRELLEDLIALAPEALLGKVSNPNSRPGAERERQVREVTLEPFFQICGALGEAVELYPEALKQEAVRELSSAFEARKLRENFQTFDDLLTRVHRALRRPGSTLLPALRRRFPVGIIDEFQDTDPIQYEIFHSLFLHPGGTLFLVGDPRQAIYAFRGGDIATYRRAVRDLDAAGGRKYTLDSNFRSSAPMIRAVNRIFRDHASAFADPEILFPGVTAPPKENGEPEPGILADGVEEPHPLRICYDPEAGDDDLRDACADRILALLADRSLRIPGREPGIRPDDIAVLTLQWREAEAIRDRLNRRGVPAVITRTGNVFASPETGELIAMMEAALEPGRLDRVIRALATPIGGVSADDLLRLRTPGGETELGSRSETFESLSRLWTEGSFLVFFNAMLTRFRVRERFPAMPGGERKLTNLLQLGDLLQKEAALRRLPPGGQLRFLEGKWLDPESADSEEAEQLLETDRAAVKIMTVHRSKGLEFPVVLLPDLFRRKASDKRNRELYHLPDGSLEYDLSGDPAAAGRAADETLQELLRLAYVAMTRAKYLCILFWKNDRSPQSALDWLFRFRSAAGFDSPGRLLAKGGAAAEIPEEMRAAPLREVPAGFRPWLDPSRQLREPELALAVDPAWQLASYTALSPHSAGGEAGAGFDYDDDEPEEMPQSGDRGGFALPGGAAAGNALHRILESLDFDADRETIRSVAAPQLRAYGLIRSPEQASELENATAELLSGVLHTPLEAGDGCCFSLSEIPRRDRLAELEFNYHFRRGFHTSEIRRTLESYAKEKFHLEFWPEWNRHLSGGVLTGFIDLVFRHHGKFFIIDWKSNRLGGRRRNFAAAALPEAMAANFYFLQYLFYTVALRKYLELRLGRFTGAEYEAQFGGVFYLFLRGVSPDHPGDGVFHDRPPYALIRQLEEIIG